MKLMSYSINNQERYGILLPGGVADLSQRFSQYPSLKDFLEELPKITPVFVDTLTPDYALDALTFLPPIINPQKILCIGMNYQAKRIEFNATDPAPTLFIRFPDSQCGH